MHILQIYTSPILTSNKTTGTRSKNDTKFLHHITVTIIDIPFYQKIIPNWNQVSSQDDILERFVYICHVAL